MVTKNKNRSLNRHHAARISIKTNNIKKCLQGSGPRKGRLRKAELHCKGKCWLCKPHKCKKFPRFKVTSKDTANPWHLEQRSF